MASVGVIAVKIESKTNNFYIKQFCIAARNLQPVGIETVSVETVSIETVSIET